MVSVRRGLLSGDPAGPHGRRRRRVLPRRETVLVHAGAGPDGAHPRRRRRLHQGRLGGVPGEVPLRRRGAG